MSDSVFTQRPLAPLSAGTPLPAALPATPPAATPPATTPADRVALGIAAADDWLMGGLRRDVLHEAYADAHEDAAGAMALAVMIAWLNHQGDGQPDGRGYGRPIIWAREVSGPSLPYGPGLAELGIDPAIITVLLLPDSRAVLRAALDSVRQGAAGTVLIELRGRQPLLDLTATRRLAMAAQDSATMVWLVRGEAQPVPSAAQTRWAVAQACASEPAAGSGRGGGIMPARPAFDLTLLRHRGGRDGLHIQMEWDRDTASFQQSAAPIDTRTLSGPLALSGLVPAVAAGGMRGAADGAPRAAGGTGRAERAA